MNTNIYAETIEYAYGRIGGIVDEYGIDVMEHAKNVAGKAYLYSQNIGNMEPNVVEELVVAALLHDVLKYDHTGDDFEFILEKYGDLTLNNLLHLLQCENESDGEFMDRMACCNSVTSMLVKMCEYEDILDRYRMNGNTESEQFCRLQQQYYDLRDFLEREMHVQISRMKGILYTYTLVNHETALQYDIYNDIDGYSIAVNGITIMRNGALYDIVKSLTDMSVKWATSFRNAYSILIFVQNLCKPSVMFLAKDDVTTVMHIFERSIEFPTNEIERYITLDAMSSFKTC